MMNFCKIFALIVALSLGACSAIQGSEQVLGEATKQKMEFNDNKARLLLISVCDMSVGSYHRLGTDSQKRAIDSLCGGQWTRPVTADDVKTLRELYELMRPQ